MASSGTIAAVVASYFVISIGLVFLNKVLMSSDGTSIPAPLFVTWFQCLVTACICWLLGELGRGKSTGFLLQFPRYTYNLNVARQVLPLSAIFVSMITFNNLCLKYVEVSFYNVARSLTIVFNVVLTWMILGKSTSQRVLMTLVVVVAGFFLGSGSEMHFSMVGTVFGMTSSLFVALNGIYTSKVLDVVEGNKWKLAAYNNTNACIMFIPILLLTGEVNVVMEHSALLLSGVFWTVMTLSGVFGFLIGIVTIMQIQVTSPLTHNISGTAKACVQTILALLLWQNPTNAANMGGVALVLFGSLLYSYVRRAEAAAAAAAAQATTATSKV
jgi:GDP-fucose transporter C1